MAPSRFSANTSSSKDLAHLNTTRVGSHKSTAFAPAAIGSRIEKKSNQSDTKTKTVYKGNLAGGGQIAGERQIAGGGLIHVSVNNRLEIKYEILCSTADSIGDSKKLVAVYSGTKPAAIMLKRQGQRPFKDSTTLGDYEIGDGSSLDLEVDTRE